MSKLKKIPKFKTTAAERTFWEKHDSSDYLDWRQADVVSMPNAFNQNNFTQAARDIT